MQAFLEILAMFGGGMYKCERYLFVEKVRLLVVADVLVLWDLNTTSGEC